MTWFFTTFSVADVKSKVIHIPGLEYLYTRIPADQLDLPQFVTDYDTRVSIYIIHLMLLLNSRFDYCNSLLYGIADCDLSCLQRVQNCLARVVCNASHFSPSSPFLKRLHLLPLKHRVRFKLASIAQRVFYTKDL